MTSLLALFTLSVSARPAQASTIYYAATNGLSTNSGLSWSSPRDFVSALAGAASGDQVWVKKGTYTGNFTATDGVAVYGGFNGTETSIGQRNITANVTTLVSSTGYNVYNISSPATKTNTFDGFSLRGNVSDHRNNDTFTCANCTFTNVPGTALYVTDEAAQISNCTFIGNGTTNQRGGGIASEGGVITISGCKFMNNEDNVGGGVFDIGGSVNITNCTFTDNTATASGGGVYASDATITGCTFTGNTAPDAGGGIYQNGGTSTIKNCTFDANTVTNSVAGDGGGFYDSGGTDTVTDCTFTSNTTAGYGAGIHDYNSTSIITGCTFTKNTGTSTGGAYYSFLGADTITNCTFMDNSTNGGGGGLAPSSITGTISKCVFEGNIPDAFDPDSSGTSSNPFVVKNNLIVGTGTSASDPDGINVYNSDSSHPPYVTFANNTIVKTYVGINFASNNGAVSVANNIFDHNDGGLNVASSVPTVTLSHNDFFNNVGYNAQGAMLTATDLMVDPLFVNSANGDYHLLLGSPCIDAGDDTYVAHGDTDLDDHPRIMGVHVDIGAYEGTESATLTSVSPAAVQAGSAAFTLTLTGKYFLTTSVVKWNGTALTTTYVSMTEITAAVPASLVAATGTGVVTVANPGAYASNSKTIAINPVATLTSLSPLSSPAGSPAFTLTVNGTKFVSGVIVSFKGAALATTFVSATQLTASVPTTDLSATGMASVTAANPGTAASNALTFTITAALVPTITSFSPASGLVGSFVTITGTNLAGVTAVRFHNANATAFSPNAAGTQINVLVPSGATTGTISVTAPGGTATSSQTFTVLFPPTITSFTPTSGPVGTVVTITGTNFTGATVVGFTGAHATSFTVNGAGTQITATVPTGAATGPIAVATPYGTAHSSASFTVTAASTNPTITGFSPTSGPVGTVVTITGTNFTGTTVVGFTGAHASFTVNSSTQITATVPTGAVTGPIAVATPNGTAKSSASFTVTTTAGPPTITSFTPTSGPVGTVITITGTNLSGTTVVGFQGQHAKTFSVNGAGTQITATVPTGAVTGPIAVATPAGTVKSSASYTVTP